MVEVHLICADQALGKAVAEQFAHPGLTLPDLREGDAVPLPFAREPGAIIIDADLLDKKNLKILQEMLVKDNRLKVFLLGHPGKDGDITAEIFTKPLRLGHLLARLQFYMHALRQLGEPIFFGRYRLDPAIKQIAVGETVIRLTDKETQLLEYLGRSTAPVTREELLAAVWGYDARIDTHTLETHIYHLRRKLDPDGNGNVIEAHQGAYALAAKT
ncbi:MAG: winged helix-turn-helix domain-containing protein [Bdellovibrionales bacterium]